MAEFQDRKQLGGGVILVGLLILISLFRQVMILGLQYAPMVFDGSWESLTQPSQPHYHPMWMPVLIGEIVANTLLLLLWAYVGWLYVSRSRLLPSLLRIGLIASIAFIVVEAFVLKTVLSTARVFSAGTAEQLAVYAVFAAVFFPYAFYSQRMRETFVN
jgi:hypothetical protein